MFDEQMRSLLAQPVIVRLTTVRPDGYPHTVPIWFMHDQGDLIMFTDRSTRKVKNVLENGKACLAIGGDPVGSPSYAIDGDITIEEDAEKTVTARITHHYESPEKAAEWLAAWREADFVVLRLKPGRMMKIS